jgi:hypothetical protein
MYGITQEFLFGFKIKKVFIKNGYRETRGELSRFIRCSTEEYF